MPSRQTSAQVASEKNRAPRSESSGRRASSPAAAGSAIDARRRGAFESPLAGAQGRDPLRAAARGRWCRAGRRVACRSRTRRCPALPGDSAGRATAATRAPARRRETPTERRRHRDDGGERRSRRPSRRVRGARAPAGGAARPRSSRLRSEAITRCHTSVSGIGRSTTKPSGVAPWSCVSSARATPSRDWARSSVRARSSTWNARP